jgi:pimeloyl-ACP methyl ester carboxylesterase
LRTRANIGAVVDFDDDRMAQRHASTALWHPRRFYEEVGGGVFFLEEYDSAKIPVLFVHGMGGSPQDWRFLVENLDRSRFQPWLVFYSSAIRLQPMADKFHEVVDELHIRYGFDRMAVVAHSMGGLVARSFVNTNVVQKEREYIRLFVTISTPWGGHTAAQLGTRHVRSEMLSWIDMVPGSEFLESLFDRELPSQVPYYLLFSYEGVSLIAAGNDDGTVSIASQLDPQAQSEAMRIFGYARGHEDILSDERVSQQLNKLLVTISE